MNIPRIVTLLICLALETVAAAVFSDFPAAIPLEELKWLVVGVTAFFSFSALVFYVGLTDAKRAENDVLEFGASRRGKMMRFIMKHGRSVHEKHCCDVYIDTSIISMFVAFLTAIMAGVVSLIIFETLAFFSALLTLTAFFGFSFLVFAMNEKGYFRWLKRLLYTKISQKALDIIAYVLAGLVCVVAVMFAGFVLYAFIYLPIESLMKLGYTLLASVGIYIGALALLPVPAYCLVGKKLLLKTKRGSGLCPEIR